MLHPRSTEGVVRSWTMVPVALLCLALASNGPDAAVVDFDQDGVPDLEDDCPTDPGNAAKKGCPGEPPPPPTTPPPAVAIKDGKLDLKERIVFKTGSATIERESYPLLEGIAQAIQNLAPTQKIRVEGHTDNQGKRAANLALSQRRAEAVVAQLVRAGVDRARLSAQGYGPDRPRTNNRTPSGRAENRRVDFVIE